MAYNLSYYKYHSGIGKQSVLDFQRQIASLKSGGTCGVLTLADPLQILQAHYLRSSAHFLVTPQIQIPAYPRTLPSLPGHESSQSKREPKPSQSYIGLIAMAILSSPAKKLVLGEIYKWITENYLYFRMKGTGWKNSIRHNLSLNECFIKSGRCPNGKGHFWTIHPANMSDFVNGDFRRRRAQQRVKRHQDAGAAQMTEPQEEEHKECSKESDGELSPASTYVSPGCVGTPEHDIDHHASDVSGSKKRSFDIESLLL